MLQKCCSSTSAHSSSHKHAEELNQQQNQSLKCEPRQTQPPKPTASRPLLVSATSVPAEGIDSLALAVLLWNIQGSCFPCVSPRFPHLQGHAHCHPQLASRLYPLPCHPSLHTSLFTLPSLQAELPQILSCLAHPCLLPGCLRQPEASTAQGSVTGLWPPNSNNTRLAQSQALGALSQARFPHIPVLLPGCTTGSCLCRITQDLLPHYVPSAAVTAPLHPRGRAIKEMFSKVQDSLHP